jgi:hypothetical protein
MELQQMTHSEHQKLNTGDTLIGEPSSDDGSTVPDPSLSDRASREDSEASQGPPMIKTRVLVLSNTYGLDHDLSAYKADLVIHCGDLTKSSALSEYSKAIALLRTIDAPLKIVIPGRNDVFLHAEKESLRTELRSIRPLALQARHMFEDAEIDPSPIVLHSKAETFETKLPNGAYVRYFIGPYAPPVDYNPFFGMWKGCDIVVTYGPPYGILDKDAEGKNIGSPELLERLLRRKPRVHCFGQAYRSGGASLGVWQDRDPRTNGDLDITPVEPRPGQTGPVVLRAPEKPKQHHLVNKKTLFINASTWDPDLQLSRSCSLFEIDLPAVRPLSFIPTWAYPGSPGTSHESDIKREYSPSEGGEPAKRSKSADILPSVEVNDPNVKPEQSTSPSEGKLGMAPEYKDQSMGVGIESPEIKRKSSSSPSGGKLGMVPEYKDQSMGVGTESPEIKRKSSSSPSGGKLGMVPEYKDQSMGVGTESPEIKRKSSSGSSGGKLGMVPEYKDRSTGVGTESPEIKGESSSGWRSLPMFKEAGQEDQHMETGDAVPAEGRAAKRKQDDCGNEEDEPINLGNETAADERAPKRQHVEHDKGSPSSQMEE